MKLMERIYLVGSGLVGFSLTDDFDCHVYAVDCGGGAWALIDAGAGRDVAAIMEVMRQDGLDPAGVSTILLTHQHADHSGGAAALCDALGGRPRVLASPHAAALVTAGDEAALSLPAARAAGIYPPEYRYRACAAEGSLTDGATVRVGETVFQVLDTPGHCRGHISLLADLGGRRVLFAGDAIFSGGQILLQNIPDCSIWEYGQTIERLASLSFETLLPGHLAPVMRNGPRHVALARSSFVDRLMPPRNIL
jgi:glyoxylase-like metal-dependent hydrolase (beta-lactamase superfamily II)